MDRRSAIGAMAVLGGGLFLPNKAEAIAVEDTGLDDSRVWRHIKCPHCFYFAGLSHFSPSNRKTIFCKRTVKSMIDDLVSFAKHHPNSKITIKDGHWPSHHFLGYKIESKTTRSNLYHYDVMDSYVYLEKEDAFKDIGGGIDIDQHLLIRALKTKEGQMKLGEFIMQQA